MMAVSERVSMHHRWRIIGHVHLHVKCITYLAIETDFESASAPVIYY